MTLDCQAPSCGRRFASQRSHAKYCSDSCRRRANKAKKAGKVVPIDGSAGQVPVVGMVAATRKELEGAGRLDSSLGQAALAAAARVDANHETGSALAALLREHRAIMGEALKGAPTQADRLDELAERRRRRASG